MKTKSEITEDLYPKFFLSDTLCLFVRKSDMEAQGGKIHDLNYALQIKFPYKEQHVTYLGRYLKFGYFDYINEHEPEIKKKYIEILHNTYTCEELEEIVEEFHTIANTDPEGLLKRMKRDENQNLNKNQEQTE